jgi:hypothetical protein
VISPARIWRTVDGDLVPNEHPDAAFLVVGAGCEVPPADEEAVKDFLAANPDAIPAPEPEVDEAGDEPEPEVDEAGDEPEPEVDDEPAAPKKRSGRHASKPEE